MGLLNHLSARQLDLAPYIVGCRASQGQAPPPLLMIYSIF